MRFSIDLISWYKKHKRDLPWRKTKDAYTIWLSEIILQQTRVDQGLSYFYKFVENYPTINDLAKAPEEDVLKHWQGLGYYSRAKNLHYTAKHIVANYNGIFPNNHKDILALKGVGEYTAAAISSFSFNQPYPVIDGNVYRVLSRVFGVKQAIDSTQGKKTFKALAEELIDKKNPATYNQAIMEFGALQCTPKIPNCSNCIFSLECFALKHKLITELPKKEKRIKQTTRYFNYLVLIDEDFTYLKERTTKDIWQGLFDFPLIETNQTINSSKSLLKELAIKDISVINKSAAVKHILSHQKIYATFWEIKPSEQITNNPNYTKVKLKEINNYPVPKLIENYIKTMV